jgi:hypothetical protein
MITFTMIVTIWLGGEIQRFNVFTAQRFNGPIACERSMEELADQIRSRAEGIRGATIEIARGCTKLETRPT